MEKGGGYTVKIDEIIQNARKSIYQGFNISF